MRRAVIIAVLAVFAQCTLFAEAAAAHIGTGITVDGRGRVYFADTLHNRIWRIDAGDKLSLLATGIHTNLLVVADDGSLYIENARPSPEAIGGLLKITPEGRITPVLGPNEMERGVGHPFAVDRQGNIYFFHSGLQQKQQARIFKRTPEGQVSLLAVGHREHADGKGSETKFTDVNSSAWGPEGSLYVRDGNSIRKVAPDGTVTTLAGAAAAAFVGSKEVDLRRPLGLAVDALGNVYVAHYWNRQVLKITPGGEASTVMRCRWPWVPTGVAVAGSDLYVLERFGNPYRAGSLLELFFLADLFGSPRVQEISPDGTITTWATVRGSKRAILKGARFVAALALAFALGRVARRTYRRKRLPKEA